MKVLYFLPPHTRHSHDYGVDFLYHGLCTVLGAENVYDCPEKASLHAGEHEPCEVCAEQPYDSDQEWPYKGHSFADAAAICDVLMLASGPGSAHAQMARVVAEHWPRTKPIVAIDYSDSVAGTSGCTSVEQHWAYYRSIAGGPLAAYFKRELPIGEQWALPLPLSYPASRIPRPMPQKLPILFYHAANHGETGPGIPRVRIATDINYRIPAHLRDVQLSGPASERLTPVEYHRRMQTALLGISWNGYPHCWNWDTNRFWEQFAYGLCQIAERPRIRIPHAPEDGVHCLYVDSVDEIGPRVAELFRDLQRALTIAQAGLNHFHTYHSSEARAAYVLNTLRLVG